MGTFAIDLLSGKEFLFNKTFGTSTSGTTESAWGGINGTITNQIDLINLVNTRVSNSVFTGYTATTNTRINALINDYNFYNTESNILALDPSYSAYTNQKIWATDTKREYLSEFVQTVGENRWISTSILYDPLTDTFYLGETADGQTQNLGQEIFLNVYNTTATNVRSNNPKVFLSINANNINDSFSDTILARADDIGDGSVYGLNTTDADSLGYFKMTTYGLLKNINTINWAIGTELYVSDTTRGELTSIKPENNAHVIGFVLKQHNEEGIIFINTIRSVPNIDSLIPIAFDYSYFNGDLTTTTAGTFFLNLRNNKGTVASATQTVIVSDDTIVGASRDSLSILFPTTINYSQGAYRGKFEISVDISQGNEKIYLEVYKADEFGNVIDSGISGETIGELGVRTFLTLSSSILDLPVNTTTPVIVDGNLKENSLISENQRFRFHIKCEKIGTAGRNKTFTINYGSNYDTWLRFTHYELLDELYDVRTSNASAGTFLKRGSNSIWTGEYIQYSDIKTSITIVSGSSYSATTSDYIIGVIATTGSSVNIYLPFISGAPKIILIIKDQGFNSAINNINIIPTNGNKIENNQTSVSIGINGGSITIYNDGNNSWFII